MALHPKRLLLAAAAPLAIAAVYGGSVAFAQATPGDSSSPSNVRAQEGTPTTPGTPATPGGSHDSSGCPNKGGSDGDDSGASQQTRVRSHRGPSSALAY